MTDKSFWTMSPGPFFRHYLKSITTSAKIPQLLPPVQNRPIKPDNIRKIKPRNDLQPIVNFWERNFRGRGLTPITIVSTEELKDWLENGHILMVAFDRGHVIGTVMSAPLGNLHRLGLGTTPFKVRWIDFFCVAPTHRGQGLGSSLLHALLDEQFKINEPASLFLKEGTPLPIPPLSASRYVWRKVAEDEQIIKQPELWTHDQLYTYSQTWVNSSRFFVNSHAPTNNTVTYAWSNLYGKRIIISISESNQVHPQDGLRILWQTGYIAEPDVTDEDRARAAKEISFAAARHFGSHWVWMDAKTSGDTANEWGIWKADGYYNIYAFHMDTGLYLHAHPNLIL